MRDADGGEPVRSGVFTQNETGPARPRGDVPARLKFLMNVLV
jgi:hypothetical protein